MTRQKTLKWWGRWWVKHFPVLLVRRLTDCRHGHKSLYDMKVCLHCGAPWFFYDKSE